MFTMYMNGQTREYQEKYDMLIWGKDKDFLGYFFDENGKSIPKKAEEWMIEIWESIEKVVQKWHNAVEATPI